MSETLEYKCPCCGGAIVFDSRSQKLKCPYCDTEFEVDALREYSSHGETDEEPEWDSMQVERPSERLEADGTLDAYQCESCGGEIVADANTAATSCPYCGNPVIVKKQFEGMLRPELVIPFKLDKKQAEQNLKEHLRGKALLPKIFKTENRIREVKGLYVPFWLYDSDAEADIRCHATRVRNWRSGDYEYTETAHFLVTRSGEISFDEVPADGSEKMPDDLMESIEPFRYEDAVEFQTAYLAGYYADRYDVSAKECAQRTNERMRQSTERAFLNTIHGYTTCLPQHTDIRLCQGRIRYAFLPVWVLSTKYRDQVYTFAMNGQTGKFVGDLPADKGRAAGIAAGVFAAAFALTFLLLGLL